MMATTPMVDPLAFSLEDLALRGGLVEVEERLALLPAAVAAELGVAEEVRLTPELLGPGVSCALGSPLLQRQVSDARALSLISYVGLPLVPPPRPAHARALGERFVVRNGLCRVVESFLGESTYVAAHLSYTATADDRHDGLLQVTVHGPDGAEPDGAVAALLHPGQSAQKLQSLPAVPPDVDSALRWIGPRAAAQVRQHIAPLQDSVARRHRRDHTRIADYYADLVKEARAPRKRLDQAALTAKVEHLLAERDAKLSDLPARFTLRVRLAIAALVGARLPVVRLVLEVHRRKLTRELVVRLPAGAQALDRLACDGCSGTTARPALCDDHLHVLCEVCVPSAQGRPRCPACLRR